jgi:hypothetical protein
LPLITPLPVTWQRRAMGLSSKHGQKQWPGIAAGTRAFV